MLTAPAATPARAAPRPACPGARNRAGLARIDDAFVDDDAGECIDASLLASAFECAICSNGTPGAQAESGHRGRTSTRRWLRIPSAWTSHACPRLPALVPTAAVGAAARDDSDANSLAALLTRDPTLAGAPSCASPTARITRAACITSLPQAVGVIGNDGLRYVVLTSVMRPILQARSLQARGRVRASASPAGRSADLALRRARHRRRMRPGRSAARVRHRLHWRSPR